MQVRDVMSSDVKVARPDTLLIEVARDMRDGDFGVVPVCDTERLVGMVTDRDIAVRAGAEGKDLSQTPVRDVMSNKVVYCFEDDDVEVVSQKMSDHQVRRIPVVNKDKKLVGIVSLGDLATEGRESSEEAGIVLSDVSEDRKH